MVIIYPQFKVDQKCNKGTVVSLSTCGKTTAEGAVEILNLKEGIVTYAFWMII